CADQLVDILLALGACASVGVQELEIIAGSDVVRLYDFRVAGDVAGIVRFDVRRVEAVGGVAAFGEDEGLCHVMRSPWARRERADGGRLHRAASWRTRSG